MVDFNSDTTVSTPAADIQRIVVLERRYNVMEVIESYVKIKDSGADTGPELALIRSRLLSFYLELRDLCKRQLSPEDFDTLKTQCTSSKYKDLLDGYMTLNSMLDSIKLTRLDTKKKYDSTNVEEENKEKNL